MRFREPGPSPLERYFGFMFWPGIVAMATLLLAATLHLLVQDTVNTQLGFDYATPQVSWNYEAFVITRVVPGRAMALAGMRENDHVLLDDVSKLYAQLIGSQGGVASISIERDGRKRTVMVRVPTLKLPLSPGLRRFLYGNAGAELPGAADGTPQAPRCGRPAPQSVSVGFCISSRAAYSTAARNKARRGPSSSEPASAQ